MLIEKGMQPPAGARRDLKRPRIGNHRQHPSASCGAQPIRPAAKVTAAPCNQL